MKYLITKLTNQYVALSKAKAMIVDIENGEIIFCLRKTFFKVYSEEGYIHVSSTSFAEAYNMATEKHLQYLITTK